jgi:hypothetical protein
MNKTFWNWRLWLGFAVSLSALLIYVLGFQTTRSVFWLSLALFILAGVLFVSGLKRASSEPPLYRGKIAGPLLGTLSIGILLVFGFISYVVSTNFPSARNAPKIGQRAPQFTLVTAAGNSVSLAQLLSTPMADASGVARPPKGVLLVFYRGYW